ncbi:TonB-dependent receptor [Bacteroides xylanisolvens]|jgi:tonB-linked outer membrane protein, susC/ragA family
MLLLVICSTLGLHAQAKVDREEIIVTGLVTDESHEPLVGVNVVIQDRPGLGAITDINGKFKIKMEPYLRLVISFIGFETQEILIKEQKTIKVVMKEAKATALDEVVVTGTGEQRKLTMTGAVTNVDVSTLKTSSSSITNALAGNVAGVLARQTSGMPGENRSEFWIRGISTFGAGSSALVLVDGFERSMNEINIEDIETFTVLKDASATAIYGSRGANGVVLITTKRGKEGKVHIDAKVETTYNTRTYTPELVDGYTYATLMNEARITRNQIPFYSDEDLHLLANGLDKDLFPNVDWMGMLLKKGAPTYRATLNINGGGSLARYYVSASYVKEAGMYNVDEGLKDYDTNSSYHRWNYRVNVDMDITKSTLVRVGIAGSLDKMNQPGVGNSVWESVMGYSPITSPVLFSDGRIPAYGNSDGRMNPWAASTQTGYQEHWNNKMQADITLEQKFDFITKGLKFVGRFGMDTNNAQWNNRKKLPEMWKVEQNRDSDGKLVPTKVRGEEIMSQQSSSTGERKEYLEAELHYNRSFSDHLIGGVLKYTQDKIINTTSNSDVIQGIDRRHQGLAGRFTYGWKYRYFVDFNFGYNGSENFAPNHQFGFFPAYSAAWNIAEEPIVKKHLKWMNMFKLRYSYGKVGNDTMNDRFPYLPSFGNSSGNGFNYSDLETSYFYDGLTYTKYATTNVTWEIATKHDIGIDFSLWDDRFTGTIDYFYERRDGIYQSRSFIPVSVGLNSSLSYATNVSAVSSRGLDGNFGFKQKIGNVNLTLRGNITYSKSKILEYDEEVTNYKYTLATGFQVSQPRGLIAEGLFKDYDDIRNSAKQTWGDVMPGDIKYRDVNGDGIVNDKDYVPIGATNRPNLIYGFGFSAQWKGFDVNVLFQGAGKSTFFIDGYTVYPFKDGDWGNILTDVVKSNRWILGENEDPNAKYPRLSYGGNNNNYQSSTYWMRNGSYLRLKNLEVGYTIPKSIVNKIRLNNIRIYFMGTNLVTFSSFKLWDPELGSSNGQVYPLSKAYTLGLTINI